MMNEHYEKLQDLSVEIGTLLLKSNLSAVEQIGVLEIVKMTVYEMIKGIRNDN